MSHLRVRFPLFARTTASPSPLPLHRFNSSHRRLPAPAVVSSLNLVLRRPTFPPSFTPSSPTLPPPRPSSHKL